MQVWLHGIISSRFECSGIHEDVLTEHDAYIIGFDRPGYGASSPHIGRTYRSYVQVWDMLSRLCCVESSSLSHHARVLDLCRAQDLRFALGVLGVNVCYVVGVSGGGPYALAFAAFEPYTVKGLLLISPAGYPGAHLPTLQACTLLSSSAAVG